MKKDEEAFRRLLQFAGPDTTPRPGFQQALLERILERARALENNPSFTLRPRRPIWIARIVSMAAAVLLVSMACWWLLGGRVGVASADFSEMLRRIRQATTAAYEQVLRLPGQPEVKVQVQIAYPGRIRTTWPEGKVQIFDLAKHTCMGLSPATRKATQVRIPVSAGYEDPLENLRRTDVSAGRLEGRGKCDGRDAVVYRIDQAEGVMRVWVAPEDELPLRIEFKVRGEDGQEAVTVLEHFRWNQPIPDSEFSLAVPPGYTLAIPESNPTEQSLIDLLRTCADLNGGVFPAKLTSLVVHDLVLKSPRGSAYLSDSRAAVAITHTDDGDDEVKEAYRSCLGGLAFVEQVAENGSWRYFGEGVRFGDSTAPVCLWNLPGSSSFRVVYGDLAVKDVPPDRLPLPTTEPTSDQKE